MRLDMPRKPPQLNIDIDKQLHKEVKIEAVSQDMSLKALVLRYIREGLERDRKAREEDDKST